MSLGNNLFYTLIFLTSLSMLDFDQNGWRFLSIWYETSLYFVSSPKFCLKIGRHDSKSMTIKPLFSTSGTISFIDCLNWSRCIVRFPSCGTPPFLLWSLFASNAGNIPGSYIIEILLPLQKGEEKSIRLIECLIAENCTPFYDYYCTSFSVFFS